MSFSWTHRVHDPPRVFPAAVAAQAGGAEAAHHCKEDEQIADHMWIDCKVSPLPPSPFPSKGLLTRSWTSNIFLSSPVGAVDVDVGIEAVDVISERDLEQVTLGIWVLGTPTWLNNLICLLFRPFPSVLFLFLPFSFLFLSTSLPFLPSPLSAVSALFARAAADSQTRLHFLRGPSSVVFCVRFDPEVRPRPRNPVSPYSSPPPTPCCSPGSSSGRVRSGRKEERKKYTWPKRHGVECICSNCRG